MLSKEARSARARLARASRKDGDPQTAEDLRRNFRYVVARDYIQELVESAPKLTDDQVLKLQRLLAGKAGAA